MLLNAGIPIVASNFLKLVAMHCQPIFTAQCYAERGYATVCRLSVCPYVRPFVTLGMFFTQVGIFRR